MASPIHKKPFRCSILNNRSSSGETMVITIVTVTRATKNARNLRFHLLLLLPSTVSIVENFVPLLFVWN